MTARLRSRASNSRKNKSSRPLRKQRGKASSMATIDHAEQIKDQHEILSARIANERAKRFTTLFKNHEQTNNFKALYEFMEESFEIFGSMMDEIVLDPPLACKSGCIHCCVNQVSLTEPEALFLGFHLLETSSPERLEKLEERARTLKEELRGKSRQEIGMQRHLYPCLFMEDGTCSIYPARPLVCRGWNSVNADMCRDSNLTGNALSPIERQPLPSILADSIQLGILQGAKNLGMETGYLLLTSAVVLLLNGGLENTLNECTEDWLNGKPFFARLSSI